MATVLETMRGHRRLSASVQLAARSSLWSESPSDMASFDVEPSQMQDGFPICGASVSSFLRTTGARCVSLGLIVRCGINRRNVRYSASPFVDSITFDVPAIRRCNVGLSELAGTWVRTQVSVGNQATTSFVRVALPDPWPF